MKKIRISLMALIVVTASTFSFTSFSEPGEPGIDPYTTVCTFHGGDSWAFLPGEGPFTPHDCTQRPNWPYAKADHELKSTHNAKDCIVLNEPND